MKLVFSAFFLSLAGTISLAATPVYDAHAPIAFLKDGSSGVVLYTRNADKRMPPASMAKMMTVFVAFDRIKNGQLRLDDTFQVSPAIWTQWNNRGSSMFLKVGETVTVENLLDGIVTLSGNDACVVLAEGIAGSEARFAGMMNVAAGRLGLTGSRFGTSNGWPDQGRTYVTARDLAELASRTVADHPALYRRFYGRQRFAWNGISQENRDPLIGRVAGADGLKTGHTEEAGYGFTGSAEQAGRRLFMVVAGIDRFDDRISESVSLIDWGFDAWTATPLFAKGAHVGEARVQMGSTRRVGLIAPRPIAVTLAKGDHAGFRAFIRYQGPLQAPVAKGEKVAELVVRLPSGGEQITPIIAAESVGQAGLFARIRNGLMALLGR